jgi:DNA-directed RNA polymerase
LICRPILWTNTVVGGYFTDMLRDYGYPDQSIVKSNSRLIKQSKISDKQIDCINNMTDVPFKINKFVLNFVLKEWEKTIVFYLKVLINYTLKLVKLTVK